MCDEGTQTITLKEYQRMVEKTPAILQSLTIPMNFLKEFQKEKFEKNYKQREKVKETVERSKSRRFSLVKKNSTVLN
jgi:hypothetical protein